MRPAGLAALALCQLLLLSSAGQAGAAEAAAPDAAAEDAPDDSDDIMKELAAMREQEAAQEAAKRQQQQQARQQQAEASRQRKEAEEEATLGKPLVVIPMTVTSTDGRGQRRPVSAQAKLYSGDDAAAASLRFCEKNGLLTPASLVDGAGPNSPARRGRLPSSPDRHRR
eukprot:SAG22_NODE_338_length_12038_cov_24.655583_6_plen_169_part_00